MTSNIINAVKGMSDNITSLKKEVTALPELRSNRAIINPSNGFIKKLTAAEEAKRQYLLKGLAALNKIENGTENLINEEEERGLEAIILQVLRPAILIKKGRFSPPPTQWKVLNDHRGTIEQSFKCVGRIEVAGHTDYEWIGTGFLVGQGVIMTNRHVALEFAELNGKDWKFISGRSSSINFIKEHEVQQSLEFAIEEIIGIHNKFDLSLLRIKEQSNRGENLTSPLKIKSTKPSLIEKQQVYVVGYPAKDGTRNEPQTMERIFSNIYEVKRLQPGVITGFNPARNELMHDCSTLGGNSGSPLFELNSSQVIGLHFSGRYLQNNYAVALWTIVDDPLLKGHVNFQ